MDDRRFDYVVRSLARHRSRRELVVGLLGGGLALLASHLRLPGAAARQGYSVQGEWCYDADQCLFAGTPLYCAYNGFGSAGAACCAAADGRCNEAADCCGPNTCYLGTCQSLYNPAPGEACWMLPGDPNPCAFGSFCSLDWQSNWGTCTYLGDGSASASGDSGEWCGWHSCESWERCCSQSSGVCAPRSAVCGEG